MNVGEVIKILKKYDEDTEIGIDFGVDYFDIYNIKEIFLYEGADTKCVLFKYHIDILGLSKIIKKTCDTCGDTKSERVNIPYDLVTCEACEGRGYIRREKEEEE